MIKYMIGTTSCGAVTSTVGDQTIQAGVDIGFCLTTGLQQKRPKRNSEGKESTSRLNNVQHRFAIQVHGI